MRRRIVGALVFSAALTACSDRTPPTAPDVGAALAGSALSSSVATDVQSLIDALFEGSNRQAATSMWTNIQKEKASKTVNLKALQSLIDNLAKFSLENLGRGRILDPDGTGPLNPTSGVVRMLGMVFKFAGLAPTTLPPPPDGFDAFFALVDPAATNDQTFVTSFGDAATLVKKGAFKEKVMLVVVRQPDDVQVNTPYPKLSKTVDMAIAPAVPFEQMTLVLCPRVGTAREVNERAVVAHQKSANTVEYLDPAQVSDFTCPEVVASAWRGEKGMFRQRTMQLASYARKAWQFFAPKPLYAAHAAIGGVLVGFDEDPLSPMVLVDPYVGTEISVPPVTTRTYGDVVDVAATIKINVGPRVLIGNPVPKLPVFVQVDGGAKQQAMTDDTGLAHWTFDCTKAGTHTLAFSFPLSHVKANAPLYGASDKGASFQVDKRALTVVANSDSRVYGDADPAFTGTVGMLYCGDQVTASYSTDATERSPVGTRSILPALSAGAGVLSNYTVLPTNGVLTITPAPLVLRADNAERLYGRANPAFTGTVVGQKFADDELILSVTTDANEASDVDTYDIKPSLTGGAAIGNYTVTEVKNGKLTVDASPLTLTVHNAKRFYGDENLPFHFSFDDVRNDDVFKVSLASRAERLSPVAEYPIVAVVTGKRLGNYRLTIIPGMLSILPRALTIVAADARREYGEPNPPLDGSVESLVDGDGVKVEFASAASPSFPAGPYDIYAAVMGDAQSNYTISMTRGTLTVTPAPLVLRADNAERLYGRANPAFTGTVVGQKFADDELILSVTTDANEASDVDTYDIKPSLTGGAAIGNYTVTEVKNGKLTVDASPLTLTVHNAKRFYGDENLPFHFSFDDVRNDDVFKVSLVSRAERLSPVGDYAIDAEVLGERLGNYKLTRVPGALSVVPRPLTIVAASVSRRYGEPNPPLRGSVESLVDGDGVEVEFASAATPSSPAGPYDIYATVTGDAQTNYSIPITRRGTLTVNPAPLTLTAGDAERLYGRANPEFTASIAGKKFADDELILTVTSPATEVSDVLTYDIVPSLTGGAAIHNYTVAGVSNGVLTVQPSPLKLTVGDATRVYGDANPPFTSSFDDLRNQDVLAVKYATLATPASAVGKYAIDATATGDKRGNYSLTVVSGALQITPRSLTVTVNDASREYGSPGPALTGVVKNAVAGDALYVEYSSTAGAAAHAGKYPITAKVDGPASGNYDVHVTDGTLTVGQAALTIRLLGGQFVYGADVCTVSYGAFKLSDGPSSLGGALGCSVSGSPLAQPAPVSVNGAAYSVMPGGLTSTDYAITYEPASVLVLYNSASGHVFIDPLPQTNINSGRTLPVKFQLFMADGIAPVTNARATVTITGFTVPASDATFVYNPGTGGSPGHYQANFKVPAELAKTTQTITAFLNDGSRITLVVYIQ